MITGDALPTLTSPRLILRPLELRDVPALFEIFSDQNVMRYWSSAPWTDPAEGVELVESLRRDFADASLYEWGVVRTDRGALIGTCTLAHIDAGNRRAEIGFSLRHDHWGQGYMTEAVRALLTFAFGELGLHRLEADVDPRNAASIRLLERLGFQREGYLRERWFVGTEINDTVLYGLLRRDWPST
jgi:RimJ/RimL family protein N-acetyltransferase